MQKPEKPKADMNIEDSESASDDDGSDGDVPEGFTKELTERYRVL